MRVLSARALYWHCACPYASEYKDKRQGSLKTLRYGSHCFSCKLYHTCLYLVSVHQTALLLVVVADIQLQLTTRLSTPKGWKAESDMVELCRPRVAMRVTAANKLTARSLVGLMSPRSVTLLDIGVISVPFLDRLHATPPVDPSGLRQPSPSFRWRPTLRRQTAPRRGNFRPPTSRVSGRGRSRVRALAGGG